MRQGPVQAMFLKIEREASEKNEKSSEIQGEQNHGKITIKTRLKHA
jgi:hypothetical protein